MSRGKIRASTSLLGREFGYDDSIHYPADVLENATRSQTVNQSMIGEELYFHGAVRAHRPQKNGE